VGFEVWAWAVEAGGLHDHQDANLHVVVAEVLAREAYLVEEVPALEQLESSALVTFSGSPSRYFIRQVVHLV
jgi:hypothetical protein